MSPTVIYSLRTCFLSFKSSVELILVYSLALVLRSSRQRFKSANSSFSIPSRITKARGMMVAIGLLVLMEGML